MDGIYRHSALPDSLCGRNAGDPAPPAPSRTCRWPASGAAVGRASAPGGRSRNPASAPDRGESGSREGDGLQDRAGARPAATLPLPPPPLEPRAGPWYGPVQAARAGVSVPLAPIVALMPPPPRRASCAEGVTRHMPIRLHPCRAPSARTRPFRARGAAFDPRHALAVCCPATFAAQPGDPARHAGMHATASPETGLRRCPLACALPQPLGSHRLEPCRLTAAPTGADQGIGVSAAPGRASTMGVAHLCHPPVPRIRPLDVGSPRGDDPAWGGPVSGGRTRPAVASSPAFSHVRSRPRKARSSMRQRSLCRRQAWSLGAQQPCKSAAPTSPSRPSGRSTVRSRTASPAPRPGRSPSRPPRTSGAEVACRSLAHAAWRSVAARTGRPTGRSGPVPVGMDRRRLTVARSRCFCRRAPRASPWGGRVSADLGHPPHPPHGPRPDAGRPSLPGGARPSSPRTGPALGAAGRLSPGPLCPAGRWAGVLPIPPCPAHVSCPGGVLPSRPAPWTWRSHARRPRREKTPPRPPAGVPWHRTPPPAGHLCHVAAAVPASCRCRVSPPVPQSPSTSRPRVPRAGASGAAHVRGRLASGRPRPVDAGGPAPPRPHGGAGVAFGARYTPRPPQHASRDAGPARPGARSPLRPPGCAVDASPLVVAVVSAPPPPWTPAAIRGGGSP